MNRTVFCNQSTQRLMNCFGEIDKNIVSRKLLAVNDYCEDLWQNILDGIEYELGTIIRIRFDDSALTEKRLKELVLAFVRYESDVTIEKLANEFSEDLFNLFEER